MTMLREAPDELFALGGAAAARLGIPDPAFVEKDFWVVELLRSVVRPIDLAPVGDVPCSAAVRFKLLHHAGVQATRTSTQALQRAGRHFFDVYQLLGSADVISALSAPGQAMEVLAADVDAKSAEFGWDHTPAPA